MNLSLKKNTGFIISLTVHAFLLLFIFLDLVFFPNEPVIFSQAIRVDLVDLPEKATEVSESEKTEVKESNPIKEIDQPTAKENLPEKEIKKTDPNEVSLKEKKKEDKKDDKKVQKKENLEDLKAKQKQALNKLKAKSAIDKIKDDLKKEKAKPFKGAVISSGTALSGLDKLQSDSYLSKLDTAVKSQWSLPEWLIGKELRTRVHIKFDRQGLLLSKKIVLSSGNKTYDDYCLQALQKASPFPEVPEKFSLLYRIDGVTVGFPD